MLQLPRSCLSIIALHYVPCDARGLPIDQEDAHLFLAMLRLEQFWGPVPDQKVPPRILATYNRLLFSLIPDFGEDLP